MKVTVIGHHYVDGQVQRQVETQAGLNASDITVIAPRAWRTGMFGDCPFRNDHFKRVKVRTLRTMRTGHNLKFIFWPLGLGLRRSRPDILDIEEEPFSAAAFQALLANRWLGGRAKTILFTWENLDQQWNRMLRTMPYRLFLRYSLAHADHIICGNAAASENLRRLGYTKGVSVFPLFGVDTEEFAPRRAEDLRRRLQLHAVTVGYVGRLVEPKGIHILLDAAGQLSGDFQLLIVGAGEKERALRQQAQSLGLGDRVVFAGAAQSKEVPDYINAMDILVLPSLTTSTWAEQFGHVLIEAMACGLAVVGSTSGEIPNVVGDAGVIFREGDARALAGLLQGLLGSTQLRLELASKARQRVTTHYTLRRIAEMRHAVYQSLCIPDCTTGTPR